jgi:predicted ATPase with chaperone activity
MGVNYWPIQPTKLEDLGISEKVVENLILKLIKRDGKMDEGTIARKLRLPVNVIRGMIESLKKRKILDTPLPMQYYLTELGKQMEKEAFQEDAYIGPAPVSYKEYSDMVLKQSQMEQRVTLEEVKEAFAGITLKEEFLRKVKEAFNSQRPILLYGPPGNGKSLITHSLHKLLQKKTILIPFAIEFNSAVINIYEPAYHQVVRDIVEEKKNAGDSFSMSLSAKKEDPRWLEITPPLVVVGTELRVSDFDVTFDGKYEAPPLVKANNGIFVVDDLGRQRDSHIDILNQFIYPLEAQQCIIRMAGGSRVVIPYKQRLFLSTNLNKKEIIDDAFNRRLLYQFLIDKPDEPTYLEIFKNEVKKRWAYIPDEEIKLMGQELLKWYKEDNRILRASDSRNICIMLDATLVEGEELILTKDLLRYVYDNFPMAYEEYAKEYE